MERQGEKHRELLREERQDDLPTDYEYRFITQVDEREKLQTLPRVFKLNLVPTTLEGVAQSRGKHKIFGDHIVYHRLTRAPLYTLTADYYIMSPKAPRRGAHRHVTSRLFYIVRGKGYEKQDGRTFQFKEGDVFVVPPFTVHQHFADPELGCEAFVPKTSTTHFLGLYWREQHEFGENPIFPPGTEPIKDQQGQLIGYRIKKGLHGAKKDIEVYLGVDPKWDEIIKLKREAARWDDEPKTTYDHYLQLSAVENQEWTSQSHVIKGDKVLWENTRQGKIKYLVGPHNPAGKWTHDLFIQEIPPGSRSGKHFHLSEELILILEGRGYDIQEGVRYDWERGDLVCVPVGTVHQHFNADLVKPAKFISAQPRHWADMGYGGFVQLEDAPEYEG